MVVQTIILISKTFLRSHRRTKLTLKIVPENLTFPISSYVLTNSVIDPLVSIVALEEDSEIKTAMNLHARNPISSKETARENNSLLSSSILYLFTCLLNRRKASYNMSMSKQIKYKGR
jgi:hypothetical protein